MNLSCYQHLFLLVIASSLKSKKYRTFQPYNLSISIPPNIYFSKSQWLFPSTKKSTFQIDFSPFRAEKLTIFYFINNKVPPNFYIQLPKFSKNISLCLQLPTENSAEMLDLLHEKCLNMSKRNSAFQILSLSALNLCVYVCVRRLVWFRGAVNTVCMILDGSSCVSWW